MDGSYGPLLAQPRARRVLAALICAWISFGMIGLAILLAAAANHSFGIAGACVAAFALGSATLAPVRGRAVDRGVDWVLPALAACYAAAAVAFGLSARTQAPAILLLATALAAGASAPPLVATTRDIWRGVVAEGQLRAAYALTSVIGDMALVGAPVLAGLLAAAVSPLAGLVLAAGAAVVGAAILAQMRGRLIAAPAKTRDQKGHALLHRPLFRELLGLSALLGGALGLIEVGLPAEAIAHGARGLSGVLLGAFGLGSAASALLFGRLEWRASPWRRYRLALAGLVGGLTVVALTPPLLPLAGAALLAGAGFGPATISLFELIDEVASDAGVEAMAWVTTAEALGIGAGSLGAGFAVSGLGTRAPLEVAPAVLAVGLIAAAAARARRVPPAKTRTHKAPPIP